MEACALGEAPVLLVNLRSGGGTAERVALTDEADARGIEPVVLKAGDDLARLASAAVARGADMLGMAGGDGSLAVVAAVAAAHELPFVCVAAGTRNHLALDLGWHDPVGAREAFGDGVERRIGGRAPVARWPPDPERRSPFRRRRPC